MSKGNGVSVLTVLGLIFIVLKLTGHITWSWVWVLAPFWGGFALLAVIFMLIFVFYALSSHSTRRY